MNAALDVIHEALQQYTRNAPSCFMTWMQPQLLNASNGADVLQAGTKKRCLDQDTVQLNDIHSAKEDFKKTAETTSLIETAGYHNADAEASSTKQGKKLAEIEREASETNDAALRLLEGSHLATPPIGATCAQPDMKSFNALLEGEKINDGICRQSWIWMTWVRVWSYTPVRLTRTGSLQHLRPSDDWRTRERHRYCSSHTTTRWPREKR